MVPELESCPGHPHSAVMNWLVFLFPWIELWTLIQLGVQTSALTALAWVFVSLLLGVTMIRQQGLTMIRQIQRETESGLIAPRFLGDELAVITSGLLLIVPGLITDFLALIVLIGPLRRSLLRFGPERFRTEAHVSVKRQADGKSEDHVTIEGDFRRLDD